MSDLKKNIDIEGSRAWGDPTIMHHDIVQILKVIVEQNGTLEEHTKELRVLSDGAIRVAALIENMPCKRQLDSCNTRFDALGKAIDSKIDLVSKLAGDSNTGKRLSTGWKIALISSFLLVGIGLIITAVVAKGG